MTLRVVFDPIDLCRVRLAEGLDPLWEMVLAAQQVYSSCAQEGVMWWRSEIIDRLRDDGTAKSWLSTLRVLAPPRGSFVDFLTPSTGNRDVHAGCEAIACLPRNRLRADLAAVFGERAAPGWVRRLAAGDRDQVHRLVEAVVAAHRALIWPFWSDLERAAAHDRSRRIGSLARGGVDALVRGLPAVRRWDGRTLELDYPVTRTLRLAGRGIDIVPSYFCQTTPVTLVDPSLPPTLIYPISPSRVDKAELGEPSSELVALLGRTRATCLAALRQPHTTSGLAHDLGVSVATASKQAAVLRDAGLLHSQRDGAAVIHELTQLGAGLLTDTGGW